MKNSGARSSVIVGLGAAALMLTSIACGSSSSDHRNRRVSGAGRAAAPARAAPPRRGRRRAARARSRHAAHRTRSETASSTEGFAIQNFVDPANLNSARWRPTRGFLNGGTYPTLGQMDGVGQGDAPHPGALVVTADFTDFNQYVELRLGVSPAKDLSGASLHAAVDVTKSFLGGAFVYAKSGPTYVYASSTGVGLTDGTFTELTMNMDTAVGANGGMFDPTMIQEIGVHIYSDSPFDGGTFAAGTYTFYIDNVIAK